MKAHEVITAMLEIERALWRLRNRNKNAKWFVLGLKSLECHAKGIRLAVEHVSKLNQ